MVNVDSVQVRPAVSESEGLEPADVHESGGDPGEGEALRRPCHLLQGQRQGGGQVSYGS